MNSIIKTPIGNIEITEDNGKIISIKKTEKNIISTDNKILLQAEKELEEYFDGKRKKFTLPLDLRGTDFQLRVWNVLRKIPYGETRSYKEVALAAGNEKASRAVGMANNKNPILIVVPCHRVIGSNGAMTGFACGVDVKKKLLELEKKNLSSQ